jgi:hypothetical protein
MDTKEGLWRLRGSGWVLFLLAFIAMAKDVAAWLLSDERSAPNLLFAIAAIAVANALWITRDILERQEGELAALREAVQRPAS